MARLTDLPKRLLVGRALRSERLQERQLQLPKRIALPIFASDGLSSVAYAPQEIFLILSAAGVSYYGYGPWIAAAVVVLLAVVVGSYRQNVHAYPSGGGDYEVVTQNLGQRAGLTVAAALIVDYVLTVAVSVSAGIDNFSSLNGYVAEHKTGVALAVVAALTLMNLRGVREAGMLFAIPTYAFIIGVFAMVGWGLFRYFSLGHDLSAPSSELQLRADVAAEGVTGFAFVFLLMRAFSSGCAALTGVEAINSGVPAFRKPKSRNAAATLLVMGVAAALMFVGVVGLARLTDARFAEDPAGDLLRNGEPVGPGYHQQPIITEVATAVFGKSGAGMVAFGFVTLATALILVLAANTAFNGFPVLGSILARDGFLPRQLHTRGDRLAFSNGITLLAVFAGVLIYVFEANVNRLIQLYIVGVFMSFTLSQLGMVRHWTTLLRTEGDFAARARMMRSRVINTIGFIFTGLVLAVVVITKFTHGAWIVTMAIPLLYLLMRAIRRHYDRVRQELVPGETEEAATLPSRVHAIVLVSKIHKPTLRALMYARASRPSVLEAVTVSVDPEETRALQEDWDRRGIPVPLKVLDSPYREVTKPIVDYVKSIRRKGPRDVVTVFIPEYVVGHWWEQLLHNQSALRLKGRLHFTPGVMVTSVPYQLRSSELAAARREGPAPGQVRRGEPETAASREREGT